MCGEKMMRKIVRNSYIAGDVSLSYYEVKNDLPALLMIHAQGTNATSYNTTWHTLSKKYHLYAVDCPGHGKSDKNKCHYDIVSIGSALMDFAQHVIGKEFYLLGHSSGGLIAAYVASKTPMCMGLILEDPPLFSCQGERRFKTFNYQDLSTVCHHYIEEAAQEDFVVYYFKNQKIWEFFPDKSREKIKSKLVKSAIKFRKKYPNKSLKVPFFPKSALEAYRGMHEYDPCFGESFYSDTFHKGVLHREILEGISCKTLLMKAKTNFDNQGTLLAAMSDEDAILAKQTIKRCKVMPFDCGHGIHVEKKKEFMKVVVDFAK